MENKAKIILARPNEWLNRQRPYRVWIDGVEVGTITNDSSEEFSVSEGNHRLQCRINWYGSFEDFQVNMRSNETVYLQVKSGMRYYWPLVFLLIIGILINLFYSGRPLEKPLWASVLQLVFVLPGLLYMLYYLAFARKKYLVIEEDKENIFA